MQIEKNKSLKPFNSFGIEASASLFARFSSREELTEILENNNQEVFILGGGSNILFTSDVESLVLKNEVRGISLIAENDDHYILKCGAGENWHKLVLYCIDHNYAGLENLSLIPGNVGAGPMQNIGAYGVELKDVFHSLEAWHIRDKESVVFSKEECEFGYRDSVFKNKFKGEFIIMNVFFRLNKKPRFNISYGAIEQELDKMGIQQLSIAAISQAVINIRQSKLPDPAIIGNAGSFFKNPVIENDHFQHIQKKYPAIVGYKAGEDHTKLAAGWMIEQCGWKGYREGDAGCHAQQALVLVNYGNAAGKQILDLSNKIIDSVHEKFSVSLEREVNIV